MVNKVLILTLVSFFLLSTAFSTAFAQETMSVEDRLLRLERAVANLEEYALLLHYNQIGSVSEFETRIGELERSFSFIVGEVVQVDSPTSSSSRSTPATTSPVVQVTQPAQGSTQITAQVTMQPTTQPTAQPTAQPTPPTSSEDLVYLQVGAFNDATAAAEASTEIERLGYTVYERPSGSTIRLFLGPFRAGDVETMKIWLSQQGYDSFVVR